MYPIVNIVNRTLGKNAAVPEGPFLKKGTQLTTFIPALHYSEENFPEPNKFKPERFDDKGMSPMRREYLDAVKF